MNKPPATREVLELFSQILRVVCSISSGGNNFTLTSQEAKRPKSRVSQPMQIVDHQSIHCEDPEMLQLPNRLVSDTQSLALKLHTSPELGPQRA